MLHPFVLSPNIYLASITYATHYYTKTLEAKVSKKINFPCPDRMYRMLRELVSIK